MDTASFAKVDDGPNPYDGPPSVVRPDPSEEIRGFVPIRCEVIELVKYWHTVHLKAEYEWFLYEYYVGWKHRLDAFGCARIRQIADHLGNDFVQEAFDEAVEEFAASVDAESWRVFWRGTPDERAAFQRHSREALERQLEDRDRYRGWAG